VARICVTTPAAVLVIAPRHLTHGLHPKNHRVMMHNGIPEQRAHALPGHAGPHKAKIETTPNCPLSGIGKRKCRRGGSQGICALALDPSKSPSPRAAEIIRFLHVSSSSPLSQPRRLTTMSHTRPPPAPPDDGTSSVTLSHSHTLTNTHTRTTNLIDQHQPVHVRSNRVTPNHQKELSCLQYTL
jgi:hypothetical protein